MDINDLKNILTGLSSVQLKELNTKLEEEVGPIPNIREDYGNVVLAYGCSPMPSKYWHRGGYLAHGDFVIKIFLEKPGPNRTQVMQELRKITNCDLQQAKKYVDSPFSLILEYGDDMKDREIQIKKDLEALGASVIITIVPD